MKHQQCVYMPSTVEDWLREQLVKRGIDAVLFTQHILYLVQSVFLNPSCIFLNNLENGLEMLVAELCVNLIDAVKKSEVVLPFLDPDHSSFDTKRDCDMSGSGSKARISEHMLILQDSKMEFDLQAILGEDDAPTPHKKERRPQQKCRRDLYLAFTQSLSQDEPKQVCTIPLGYTASNDLRIPRVDTLEQAIENDADHDTVPQYNDKMVELSSEEGSPRNEDRNLARLIAKFDSSIEALWNPDESVTAPDFTEASEESDRDFNSSFQQLDPSPIPMDIPSNKQNSFSFIPYGTNISSIWSSQPSPEELLLKPKEEDTFASLEKLKKIEDALVSHKTRVEQQSSSSDSSSQHTVDSKFSERSSWNVPNPLPEHMIQTLLCEVDNSMMNNEGKVHCYIGTDCNDSFAALNHSKEGSSFTEVKPRALNNNFIQALKPFALETLLDPYPTPQVALPDMDSGCLSPPKALPPISSLFFTTDSKKDSATTKPSQLEPVEKRRKEKEEEPVDLLVSQSTHFSPIRKEARTSSKQRQNETLRYEDGTTFAIPNALKRLNFTRSASGALYLDEDSDEGSSPKKYMEFKEGNPSQGSLQSLEKDFVPKFRVKQNEKCCQTDREDLDEFSMRSDGEKSATWAQVKFVTPERRAFAGIYVGSERGSGSVGDGDLEDEEEGEEEEEEEEVEEEVRKTIEGRTKVVGSGARAGRMAISKKDACLKCARSNANGNPPAWATDWPSESSSNPQQVGPPPGIWQGAFTLMTLQPASQHGYPAWSEADSGAPGGSGLCWECVAKAENHKSQLREELIQEGEQLLTDLNLNSLSHLYLLDEKRDHSEKVADYVAPFANNQMSRSVPHVAKSEAEWTKYERTAAGGTAQGTAQKERKRRFSSSQRACSFYMEGSCRRPHCRFSHEMAAIPCLFWGDASCLKGSRCPFLHTKLHSLLRPVTL